MAQVAAHSFASWADGMSMAGVDVSSVLANAIALASEAGGDAAGAERGYRQILQIQPAHPDALHLLGVICGDRGDLVAGIDLIKRRALRPVPRLPSADLSSRQPIFARRPARPVRNVIIAKRPLPRCSRAMTPRCATTLAACCCKRSGTKRPAKWFAAALERDPRR